MQRTCTCLGAASDQRHGGGQKNDVEATECLVKRAPEDDHVVEVHKNEVPVEAPEHELHETLKRGWCISKSHGHNRELIQIGTGRECRFGLVKIGMTDSK